MILKNPTVKRTPKKHILFEQVGATRRKERQVTSRARMRVYCAERGLIAASEVFTGFTARRKINFMPKPMDG